jgi:hypothetical protein
MPMKKTGKPKSSKGAMAMAAKTVAKAKAQAAVAKTSGKRGREQSTEELHEAEEQNDTGSDSLDEADDGSESTTSSEVSRFIDRRERLAALKSELSIELQTEQTLETSILQQKKINAKKLKELATARNDYPSEQYDQVTSHVMSLHNTCPDIPDLGHRSRRSTPKS